MRLASFDPPLRGVRVLDVAAGRLGVVGRQLGELGADVIRVVPATAAPRLAGYVAEDCDLDVFAANLGKSCVEIDLSAAAGRARFEALVAAADILIETSCSNAAGGGEIDAGSLHMRYPALVILSISDFGRSGVYGSWRATGPVLLALSGMLSRSGIAGRPPLLPPGELAVDAACGQALFDVLLVYLNRLKTGQGAHLDFAMLDAAAEALDPGYGIAGSATAGVAPAKLPRGRPDAGRQYPIFVAADGFVRICILSARQWRGMFEWLGRPAEFADPTFATLKKRYACPALLPAIAAFFATKSRHDIEAEGQKYGVPAASLLDLAEIMASEQICRRQALQTWQIAPGVRAAFPGGVFEIDGVRAGPVAPALDGETEWRPRAPLPPWPAAGGRPLAGLVVLDLGVIVVGAETGRLLADQGAEVIKIESSAFPDGSRQTGDGSCISNSYAAGQRNRKSFAVDLRRPEGRALFLQLVAQSDVMLSNFKPGTLDSLSLGRDILAQANSRLVTVESSAFGAAGPWSRRLGYGPLVRAAAGFTRQWCYPDDPASFSDAVTVYPDHVAGRIGAAAVLALLLRRLRTAQGGSAGIAQSEVMLSHMAGQIAAISLAQQGVAVTAPLRDVPWGVFPARGDDEWVVVTMRDDAQFRALCGVMGRRALGAEPALATRAGRVAAAARIEQALTGWLAERDPHEAMAVLQAAGIPAGRMLRVSELPAFAYFRRREFFREVTHPEIAEPFFVGVGALGSQTLPDPPQSPAPLLGEHTREIARRRLGLTEAEIDRLLADSVIEAAVAG